MDKLLNRLIIYKDDSLAWIEITIVAIISIYVWMYANSPVPHSPVNSFFWPVIGPLLISLRYGFAKGFTCAIFTALGLALMMKITGTLESFPLSPAIGTLLTAAIAGEFRNHWHRLNQKLELEHKCMHQKIDSFTKNYHLLKVSHDQLEQHCAGQSISLRSEINALQNIAAQYTDRRFESLRSPLLNLIAEIGGLQVAGIYKMTNSNIEKNNCAVLGDQHQLKTDDPMLQDMLATKKLLSPATLSTNEEHNSRYQLCIPLLDTSGVLQAVIVAESVKFALLTPANIALLSLIASNAADLLNDDLLTPILEPHQADLFALYVQRAQFNKRHYGVDSSLVVFSDPSGTHTDLLNSVVNVRRGTDIYWTCRTQKNEAQLMVLLPLTTPYDTAQYIERVKALLTSYSGNNIQDIDILGPLSFEKDEDEINQLIDQLEAYDENMAIPANTNL